MVKNTAFNAFCQDFKKYEILDTPHKRETIANPSFVRSSTPLKMNQQIFINGQKLTGLNMNRKNK